MRFLMSNGYWVLLGAMFGMGTLAWVFVALFAAFGH